MAHTQWAVVRDMIDVEARIDVVDLKGVVSTIKSLNHYSSELTIVQILPNLTVALCIIARVVIRLLARWREFEVLVEVLLKCKYSGNICAFLFFN